MRISRFLLACLSLPALAFPLASAVAACDRIPAQAVSAEQAGGGGWLGVYLQEVTRDIAESLDLDDARGALVSEVITKSPADEAGIVRGDVIVSVDGDEVTSPDDLIRLVRRHDPADRLRFEAIRDGKNREFQVKLGTRPASAEEPRAAEPRRGHEPHWMPEDPDSPGPGPFREFGGGPSAFLGVRVVDLNEDLGPYFQRELGALVVHVGESTPAEKAGLKAGDVITAVNGRAVEKAQDLVDAIAKAEDGDRVEIEFVRKGESRSLDAQLEGAPGRSLMRLPQMEQRRLLRDPLSKGRDDLRRDMDELRRDLDDLRRQLEKRQDRDD
jgi:C-terminal processing protease CtpA/Prc